MSVVAVLVAAGRAEADPAETSADLDGLYIAAGPLGSAVRVEGEWDGAFGGEISLVRVTERRVIAAVGLSLGGVRFAERSGGRLWADLQVGSRRPFGVTVGLGAGPTVEVDDVNPPRWGAQGAVWLFAGVIPYFRVGSVQNSGVFVDIGLKIALPARHF